MIEVSADFSGLRRLVLAAGSGVVAVAHADPLGVVLAGLVGWLLLENHRQHVRLKQYERLRRGLRRAVAKD